MNLKVITILVLIDLPALIGTTFAVIKNGYGTDDTKRSKIRDHMSDHMGNYENEDWCLEIEDHIDDHWDKMEEHWTINSLSSRRCH